MPATLQDRPVHGRPDHSLVAGRRLARRRRVPVRLIAAGAGLAVLLPVGLGVREWVAGWGNPLEPEVVDRSTAPLLLALDDLAEYHAATADLQVMVDLEVNTPWVPSVISGERVHFLATGTADAYVDFEGLDDGAVTLSPDGTSATIVLPAPELSEVRIDPEESRVVDRDRGLVERVGDAFAENPIDDSELYALAERRLGAAAAESDVLDRAEDNTREMLTGLGQSLGVDEVTVEFEAPVGAPG
jgi:Protein of unknown function (DUF4230)